MEHRLEVCGETVVDGVTLSLGAVGIAPDYQDLPTLAVVPPQGLEPWTHGLTCCTGLSPATDTACSLDYIFTFGRAGQVRRV